MDRYTPQNHGDGVDELHGMRRDGAGRAKTLPALSSPKVVHAQEDLGLPADHYVFGSGDKGSSDVRRPDLVAVVWLNRGPS
jgi:hypothetical protein